MEMQLHLGMAKAYSEQLNTTGKLPLHIQAMIARKEPAEDVCLEPLEEANRRSHTVGE